MTNAGKTGIVNFYHDSTSLAKSDTVVNDRAVVEFYDSELGVKSSWMYLPEYGDNIGKNPYSKFPAIAGFGPFRLLKSGKIIISIIS